MADVTGLEVGDCVAYVPSWAGPDADVVFEGRVLEVRDDDFARVRFANGKSSLVHLSKLEVVS